MTRRWAVVKRLVEEAELDSRLLRRFPDQPLSMPLTAFLCLPREERDRIYAETRALDDPGERIDHAGREACRYYHEQLHQAELFEENPSS